MPSGGNPPKGVVAVVAALLIISIANNTRMLRNSSVRTVEIVSLLATGVLAGILVILGISHLGNKKE